MRQVFTVVDEVPVDPTAARVYEHGWQSWSPSGVYDVRATSARPELAWQQVIRFRPGVVPPTDGFQAEGLLVVDPGTGEPARLFGTADPGSVVPSIRARLEGDRLVVSADDPAEVIRTSANGLGAALADYGDRCGQGQGARVVPAPTVWCSWYRYFLDVTEADIVENLEAFDREELPVDVVQVDDGWQASVGDWLHLSPRFASIRDLATRIRDTGRRAGIWLAPFVVSEHSALAKAHPDWLHGHAGTNWGGSLHGLDLTRPDVRDYLVRVFAGLREAGYDYFKLDFLYAGALPGTRALDVSPEAAYRSGLQLIREAVGEDAYLLGCGAPILPSVGLVDAMRVSPDTYNPEDLAVPGGDPLRGRPAVLARAWQQGRLWVNDADCLITRPSFTRRAEWAAVVERYGGLRSFSDRVADLDPWALATVRRLLGAVPDPVPFTELPDAYQE